MDTMRPIYGPIWSRWGLRQASLAPIWSPYGPETVRKWCCWPHRMVRGVPFAPSMSPTGSI